MLVDDGLVRIVVDLSCELYCQSTKDSNEREKRQSTRRQSAYEVLRFCMCNLEIAISKFLRNLEIGTQFPDSENVLRLKIVQIPKLTPLRPVYISIVTVRRVSPSLYVQLSIWVIHYDAIGGARGPEGACDVLGRRGVNTW